VLHEESGLTRRGGTPARADDAADESRSSGGANPSPDEQPLAVLLVTSNLALAERLRRGLAGSRKVALTVRSAPRKKTPLAHLAAETGARLIVVDSELFAKGMVGLSFPANPEVDGPEVLLLFDTVGESAVQLSLLSRAQGCLQSDVSPEEFSRAVDAVVHGHELWFPRWMMEPFYDMALAAMATARPVQHEAGSALTVREVDVLRLVQRGMTNKLAAEHLGISPNTVKKHLHNALMKRGIQRRRQLFE
jgi:DNA-binding NarL/FixJ family response regulator